MNLKEINIFLESNGYVRKFSMRGRTPVWNQKCLGICCPIAVADLVTHYNQWVYGRNDIIASGQELIDVIEYTNPEFCLVFAAFYGLHSIKHYPFTGMKCPNPKEVSSTTYKIPMAYVKEYTGVEPVIIHSLMGRYGPPLPVLAHFCVNPDNEQLFLKWAPGDNPYYSSGTPNHIALITGYDFDADPPFWEVKSAYTEDWGDGGYGHLAIQCVPRIYFVSVHRLGSRWRRNRLGLHNRRFVQATISCELALTEQQTVKHSQQPPPSIICATSMPSKSKKREVSIMKMPIRHLTRSRVPAANDLKREFFKKLIYKLTAENGVSSVPSEVLMCRTTSDANSTCVDDDFSSMLKHLMLCDAQVVSNCLFALQEIWNLEANTSEEASRISEGLLSKRIIYYLLNWIKDFTEWARCVVPELAAKYVPSDSLDIMNLLEDRLQHANGAVVLATIKLFLKLSLSSDAHQQEYGRIKAPLLTQASSGIPEQSFAVLSHLHILAMHALMLFSSDYMHIYCQFGEPFYGKKLKLEMLTSVSNGSTTYDLVKELREYIANIDIPMALENVALQYDVNAILDRLLQILEMEKDHVSVKSLVLLKDLFRKHPERCHDCIAVVGNISSKNVHEPKAKAALIWMLGEYAQDMQDAPVLVENWDGEYSAEVCLHLLTSVVRCFMRKLPEILNALGAAGSADFHQDVRDRALFYYGLLQDNVSVAEQLVNHPKHTLVKMEQACSTANQKKLRKMSGRRTLKL